MDLRVAIYDNVCNIGYHIVRALREQEGCDAHLFLDERFDPQRLPEHDDVRFLKEYPPWIHKKNYEPVDTLFAPWRSPLIKELREFPFFITMNWGVRFAPFVQRPYAVWTAGGDLTIYPFPGRFSFLWPRLKDKMALLAKGYWQRRGLRRATEIWTQPFSPFRKALERLAIPPGQVAGTYFPIPIDVPFWSSKGPQPASEAVQRIHEHFDFFVFHPSRLTIKAHAAVAEAGDWKRNDLLFEGFAEFVRQDKPVRAGLVLIDRELSYDMRLAKEIICRLGIEQHVLWLKPPQYYGFSRQELIDLYAASDVTAVDFGAGWFGSVLLEALAVGCPVISYIDEPIMRQLYSSHPVLSANTAEGIARHFSDLYNHRVNRTALEARNRQWILGHHSYSAVAPTYMRRIKELIALHSARGE